eukprot:2209657-Lingulodinium_polyedra.AAC.1
MPVSRRHHAVSRRSRVGLLPVSRRCFLHFARVSRSSMPFSRCAAPISRRCHSGSPPVARRSRAGSAPVSRRLRVGLAVTR